MQESVLLTFLNIRKIPQVSLRVESFSAERHQVSNQAFQIDPKNGNSQIQMIHYTLNKMGIINLLMMR